MFLLPEDEAQLSHEFRTCIPQITFLNDHIWPEAPDIRDSIERCDTGRVYLYAGMLADLPTQRRQVGDVQGPASGCVIQVLRSKVVDDELVSGSIGVGFEQTDHQMYEFVSLVWKCLRQFASLGVKRADGTVDKKYFVGPHAKQQACAGEIRLVDGGRIIRFYPIKCG